MGVRLLQGSEQVQHIPLDLGSPLIQASSADPHVIILTEDGQLILLTLREIKQGVSRLTVQRPTNFTLVWIRKNIQSLPSSLRFYSYFCLICLRNRT